MCLRSRFRIEVSGLVLACLIVDAIVVYLLVLWLGSLVVVGY